MGRRVDLAEHLRRDGVTYNVYGDGKVAERPWSLDPVPLVPASSEWEQGTNPAFHASYVGIANIRYRKGSK